MMTLSNTRRAVAAMIALSVLSGPALAAGQPALGAPPPAWAIVDSNCALSDIDGLVGRHADVLDSLPGDLWLRVFTPEHMIATMDYWPHRLNVLLDAEDRITRASCG